jgi:glutamyl-tRNA synthetase
MVEKFDVADVNPNPARFDLKKAEAINAAHVRLLAPEDFRDRLVPYLHAAGLVPADSYTDLAPEHRALLDAGAPLVQERMTLLGEAVGMLGFLFVADDAVEVVEDARAALRPEAADVLDTAARVLGGLPADGFTTEATQTALAAALVAPAEEGGLGIKARFAYTPLRVALTGRRVSPPLFESMEILGKDATLARVAGLRAGL